MCKVQHRGMYQYQHSEEGRCVLNKECKCDISTLIDYSGTGSFLRDISHVYSQVLKSNVDSHGLLFG